MRTNVPRASAQIVQFPVGGRAGLAARRAELRASDSHEVNPAVIFGSWYHEEAIKEDAGHKN